MSKIRLEDFVQYGRLFDTYGKLLSEDRQQIMSLYFDCNMTLAEIANERQISRQAVLDAIQKSCEKLKQIEDVLHTTSNRQKIQSALEEILNLCQVGDTKKIQKKVEEILKEI